MLDLLSGTISRVETQHDRRARCRGAACQQARRRRWQWILSDIRGSHSVVSTSQHSSSAHCSRSQAVDLASRCIAPLGNEGSRSVIRRPSLPALAVAAAGVSIAATLVTPALASAAAPVAAAGGFATDWGPYGPGRPNPGDWHHPEWGPGWNDGYPAPGWVPPIGWAPPPDWTPPAGWYPPPGWAPPPTWVGPCAGPLFDSCTRCAVHSLRPEPASLGAGAGPAAELR